jgi:hypothetical protein
MNDNEMEQAIAERGLTAPRITAAHIDGMMARVIFGPPQYAHTSTFVHAFLDGKFFLATGHSACVSMDNFDPELGSRLARDDAEQKARNRLWELEGYRLYAQQGGAA